MNDYAEMIIIIIIINIVYQKYGLTSIDMEKVAHLLLHQHEENTTSGNYPSLNFIILELQQTCLFFGELVWNFYHQIECI